MSASLLTAGPLIGGHHGLVARLQAFFPPSHFAFGVVPARLNVAGWQRLLKRTPFVGIGWTGIAPDRASGRVLRGDMQWTVFLAGRAEHSPETRLTGSPQLPGIYGMTQVALACLQGFVVKGEADAASGPVGHVSVTEVANLTVDGWDDEAVAIAGINITIGFGLMDQFTASQAEEFRTLGIAWEFDPGIAAANDTITTGNS